MLNDTTLAPPNAPIPMMDSPTTWQPLLPFLTPFELLKLLYVSKSARMAAVAALKACEADPETRLHAARFKKWLTSLPHRLP